ncbi:hypothetical protein [Paenibacillus polymyxa]|uniref:hypothetical protein n=1 Tax=Paenibacillus polymyxa TaxID=1406 RepID=UPI0011DE14C3|nr:hypothetical protein [Paenibacillus polymyxa]WPQ59668.1 hypothetical protein SKN87_28835 [Paenibacillus polymyxa]
MINAESIIEKLSDEQLKQAYEEIKAWRDSGMLENGIIRDVQNELQSANGSNVNIFTLSEPFLWEICKRRYEEI